MMWCSCTRWHVVQKRHVSKRPSFHAPFFLVFADGLPILSRRDSLVNVVNLTPPMPLLTRTKAHPPLDAPVLLNLEWNIKLLLQVVVAKCDSNQVTPSIVWSLLATWWVLLILLVYEGTGVMLLVTLSMLLASQSYCSCIIL